jgi:hypothetical protein
LATTYKILGQSEPANANNATLYTVPASTSAIVSTITVCNTSANDTTFRIFVVPQGGSPGTSNAIFYDGDLVANTTISFTLGLTLQTGAYVSVRTSTASAVTFQAFGSELS